MRIYDWWHIQFGRPHISSLFSQFIIDFCIFNKMMTLVTPKLKPLVYNDYALSSISYGIVTSNWTRYLCVWIALYLSIYLSSWQRPQQTQVSLVAIPTITNSFICIINACDERYCITCVSVISNSLENKPFYQNNLRQWSFMSKASLPPELASVQISRVSYQTALSAMR